MPIMFQTGRALSALGSLACTTALVAAFVALSISSQTAAAAEATPSENSIEHQIQALVPSLEDYISANMKSFDVPGLAIGIVAGDKLIYAKGFGVRCKGGAPVDTQTLFQIGSTTKAFLSTTMAIAVDQGKLHWDDRIVDLDPEFQLRDPWVTREFRFFDLMAQRSGLPPYANECLMPARLRPISQNSLFALCRSGVELPHDFRLYQHPHILAGRIVARAEGAADWNAVLQSEILDPLGMKNTTYTRRGDDGLGQPCGGPPLHSRWKRRGAVRAAFPYDGRRGGRHQLEHRRHGEMGQLAACRRHPRRQAQSSRPRTSPIRARRRSRSSDKASYALGWVVQQTPNGDIVWHNGGTFGFGAIVALQLDRNLGVIVLSNQSNFGMPGDALGLWTLDRLLGNPMVDHGAKTLAGAKTTICRRLEAVRKAGRSATLTAACPACRQFRQSLPSAKPPCAWTATLRHSKSPQAAPSCASTHGTAPSTPRRWCRTGSLRQWPPT